MFHKLTQRERGQGLVEYALILVLVAVVVIIILAMLGPAIGNIFCNIVGVLSDDTPDVCLPGGVLAGTGTIGVKQNFIDGSDRLHIQATFNGGYDPAVSLTITMPDSTEIALDPRPADNDYRLAPAAITGCPCEVTLRSSTGAVTTVTAKK